MTEVGICRTLRRVFDMYNEGLDLSSARRALKEVVRFSTSAGVKVSAPDELGKMTVK